MIPIVAEPEEMFLETRTYENCHFNCGRKTKYWYIQVNQPICPVCAVVHKKSEVDPVPGFKYKGNEEPIPGEEVHRLAKEVLLEESIDLNCEHRSAEVTPSGILICNDCKEIF